MNVHIYKETIKVTMEITKTKGERERKTNQVNKQGRNNERR